MARPKKDKLLDNGNDFRLEREFHEAMKQLVRDTLDLLKDDKQIRRLIKRYRSADVAIYLYAKLADCLELLEINIDDLPEVSEEFHERAVDVHFAKELTKLYQQWAEAKGAENFMPSLTWPVVKV